MKRRRFILAILWLLSLILISVVGGAASYFFFWAVTLVAPVMFLYLAFVAINFKIHQELESRDCVSGQPVPYFFVLQNESPVAFASISVKMYTAFSQVGELPDDIEYELLPGDRFTWNTTLTNRCRGEYEVGVKEIILRDFLRLFTLRIPNPGTIKALVSPRYVRLEKLRTVADFEMLLVRETNFPGVNPASDVREYVSGDDVRLIHWACSARLQKPMVRNLDGEERYGLSIFMDTRRFSGREQEFLPLENKMLETVLAIGGYFAERDIGFSMYCSQNRLMELQVGGACDFEPFYTFCSGLRFGEEEDARMAAIQMEGSEQLFCSSVVLFVVHTLEGWLYEMTERLVNRGAKVLIYLVTDELFEMGSMQQNWRRRVVVIPTQARLEEVL